ncbi:MAG: Ig-like domain-containing protein [Gemmatimonadota bacterium]
MAVVLTSAVATCGGSDGTAPSGEDEITALRVTPARTLLHEIGGTLELEARTLSGAQIPTGSVAWRSSDESVATVAPGGVATAAGAGTAWIVAEAGSAADSATLEVHPPELDGPFAAGTTYFGRADYIEYQPGTLPLILSAAHGGALEPSGIPDRTWGTTVTDANTEQLARTLADAVEARTGQRPHLVICRLKRTKLDPNRAIEEAAQGNPYAELAWKEFQGFIDAASETVEDDWAEGLYIDLHGHGHDIQRLELGYLLSGSGLGGSDDELDRPAMAAGSSVRHLAENAPHPFHELIRGGASLGTLLEDRGYPSVPSAADPDPGGAPYFTGGYNTVRHGSRDGGTVDGVQIEMNYQGVRSSASARSAFSEALVDALEIYFETWYGIDWTPAGAR